MNTPNLLFIYTDEQAFSTMAAYGNTRIEMPNLNRLAEQSVIFDEAYVTQPACTPSRSTLLTGLWPHTNGCTENNVPLETDTPCLPEMITRGKYATGHFGKWHLGDELFAQHGFQEWISIEDMYNAHFTAGRDRSNRSDYHHFLRENGFTPENGEVFDRRETTRFPEEFSKPAFLARETARFLRKHRDDSFVLYVNFLEPHMPFTGPRDDQYDVESIPLPDNFEAVPGAGQPLKTRLLSKHYYLEGAWPHTLNSEDGWRRLIAHYWGLCSLVDTHIGAILNTLDDCGLQDNTIVVFTSDHGDMMGAHQLAGKCVMYREAVRVPFMIRLPGQTRSKRIMGPVSQVDIVPTLLDLMNQPVPAHLQGKSLRPWIEQPDRRLDDPVFIEWNGPDNDLSDVRGEVQMPDWMTREASPNEIVAACTDPVRTVITPDGWKFNCSPLGEHELYNLQDDPGETRNVFEQNKTLARKLRGLILDWQQLTQDRIDLPDF